MSHEAVSPLPHAIGAFTGTMTSGGKTYEECIRLARIRGEADILVNTSSHVAYRWLDASRFTDALALCRMARQWGETPQLLLEAGRAETRAGDGAEAGGCFQHALGLTAVGDDSPDDELRFRSRLLFEFSGCLMQTDDGNRALSLLDECQALCGRLGDVRSRAVTLGQIAGILFARGELDEALRIRQEEELPVYERLGDVRSRVVCRANIAITLVQRGRKEDIPIAVEHLGWGRIKRHGSADWPRLNRSSSF